MEDISIELLEKIKKSFSSGVKDSKKISDLLNKLENKKVDYEDAQKYAIEIGELLAKAFEENIDSASLPNGKMYYNIAKKIVDPELKDGFEKVSDYSMKVQKVLNEDVKIGLKVQKPKYNQARSNGIIRRLADAESYDDISWILKDPVVNFNQSVVDDTIKANAEMHYKSGRCATITRKVAGKACAWCMNLAGTYAYPNDVPDEIFHRHRDCRCIVMYKPSDKSYVQDVWDKNKYKDEKVMQKVMEKEKKVKYINENSRRARLLNAKSLDEYDALNYLISQSKDWVSNLTKAEKKSINKYSWNGKEKRPKFYERLNAFLRGDSINESEKTNFIKHSNIISNALKKSRINENIVVFRTLDKDYLNQFEIGEIFTLNQFISTSCSRTGPFTEGVNYKFYIHKGTRGCAFVKNISHFKKQNEVLIDKDVFYKLLCKKGNVIEVEVLTQ